MKRRKFCAERSVSVLNKGQHIVGCLLGTAVGDALGLPYEGLTRDRATRLLGLPDRHRFFFGRGMVSDDTEHSCMVAQSLLEHGNDVDLFAMRLAHRLRWWILALPAGVGKATARACVRLWLGVAPSNAGVFSAGNGPAMRASIFGAAIDEVQLMLQLVRVSSRLTHSDPKAEFGAVAVALAARHSCNGKIDANLWLNDVVEAVSDDGAELVGLLRQACKSVNRRESTLEFADAVGLSKGVTGYTYHTVPIAAHAWLSYPQDFRMAVASVIKCGGDTDTTAAIVGGIVGAGVGRNGIPDEWIAGLRDWPRSVNWIQELGEELAASMASGKLVNKSRAKAIRVAPMPVIVRNMFFLFVVLFHGFRRLAPPY